MSDCVIIVGCDFQPDSSLKECRIMESHMNQSQISQAIFDKEFDLQALILAYQNRILSICYQYARDENEAEDLAQDFIANKILEKNLVAKYRLRFSKLEDSGNSRLPFRKYLYRSVANHCIEHYRKKSKLKEIIQNDIESEVSCESNINVRQDLEYAMGILYRAFSKVRDYYVKKNKEYYWLIFKETVLDKSLKNFNINDEPPILKSTSQKNESVKNILSNNTECTQKKWPRSMTKQEIYNIQTTVKRMLISTLDMIFESEADNKNDPSEKNLIYSDWMEIILRFDESAFTALRAALRIGKGAEKELSEQFSMSIGMSLSMPMNPEDITTDELSYLLTYRVDMPLVEWIDSSKLIELIPSKSLFMPGLIQRDVRQLSLAVLISPTPSEEEALDKIGAVELLKLIKESSKKLANVKDHSVPPQIFILFYTLISLLALKRHHVKIYSISEQTLRGNINWYMKQEWLDERISRFFKTTIKDPRVL
jgi:RNA polymerase sigma factor (sigma-70 family)